MSVKMVCARKRKPWRLLKSAPPNMTCSMKERFMQYQLFVNRETQLALLRSFRDQQKSSQHGINKNTICHGSMPTEYEPTTTPFASMLVMFVSLKPYKVSNWGKNHKLMKPIWKTIASIICVSIFGTLDPKDTSWGTPRAPSRGPKSMTCRTSYSLNTMFE